MARRERTYHEAKAKARRHVEARFADLLRDRPEDPRIGVAEIRALLAYWGAAGFTEPVLADMARAGKIEIVAVGSKRVVYVSPAAPVPPEGENRA